MCAIGGVLEAVGGGWGGEKAAAAGEGKEEE